MTEERFWELAEEGARLLVLAMQWLLVWPFILLGLLASVIEARRAETAKQGSVADESAVGNAETPGKGRQ